MYRFEKLQVWQKSMDLCVAVYEKTKLFPREEAYGLSSQARRAATSTPLNIAEGSACKSRKEFVQFLTVSLRSQYELTTVIRLASRLKYLRENETVVLEEKTSEVGRLLQGLINSLSSAKNQQLKTNNF